MSTKPEPIIHRRVTPDRFAQIIEQVGPDRQWILDTETNGLMVRSGKHEAKWIGMTPSSTAHCFIWTREEFDAGIRALAQDLHLVGHNLRFDLHALRLDPPKWDDTMVHLAYTCTSQPLSLDDQARTWGWPKIKTDSMLKSKEKWGTNRIDEMDEAKLCEYLWDDCVFTAVLWDNIKKSEWEMDKRTEEAVRRMEQRGVRLYADGLAEFERLALRRYEESKDILRGMGFEGLMTSPKQVGDWLHSRGVKLNKTKTGAWSTNKVDMQKLADAGDESVLALLASRTGHKLGYGLVANLRGFTEGGMIYPSVRTAGITTGRFSYSDPPLQQIPKRDPMLGPAGRKMFGSSNGYVCGADFSQVELRVAAALAQETVLIDAFAQGRDPHTETAASALGISLGDVTEQQRFGAKAINFGILNGMKAKRLALEMKCSVWEAQKWIDNHRRGLPRLHDWMESTWELAKRERVVRIHSGRTRVFTGNQSTLPAVSMWVQGTAADLMRAALVALDEDGAEPILSVHDEIICQNPLRSGNDIANIMSTAANAAFPCAVDFKADGGQGERWYDVH